MAKVIIDGVEYLPAPEPKQGRKCDCRETSKLAVAPDCSLLAKGKQPDIAGPENRYADYCLCGHHKDCEVHFREYPKQEKQQGFWRPEVGQRYYCWSGTAVYYTINHDKSGDRTLIAIGNCFPTREQCLRYGELMKRASVFIACAIAADPDVGECRQGRVWTVGSGGCFKCELITEFPAYVHTKEQAEDLARRLEAEDWE
jgi:hypothetical protein